MLRKTAILATIMCAFAATAQEKNDTLLQASNVNLLVTETPEELRISASDSSYTMSWTEKYPENATVSSRQQFGWRHFSKNKNVYWDISSGNLMFGFCNAPGAPAALDLEMGKSFEISWLNVIAAEVNFKKINSSVKLGIGLSWRNYRTTTGMRFAADNTGAVSYTNFEADASPRYSRLKTFSLSFPLLFTHRFNIRNYKDLALQFGPVLNWNSHASIKSLWYDSDGKKNSESTSLVAKRAFSVDLYCALSLFKGVGVYVRYSPQSVLRHSPDLDFSSLSSGITIGL